MRLLLLFISLLLPTLAFTQAMQPGTFNVCDGELLDPNGNKFYGNNQDITATYCPQTPGTQLAITFLWSDIIKGDLLCIYDGKNTQSPELSCSSRWTGARIVTQATANNTSGCLTLHWKTNGSRIGRGFAAKFECKPICQPIKPILDQSKPEFILENDIPIVRVCPGQLIELTASAIFPQNGVLYNQESAETEYEWLLPKGRSSKGKVLQWATTVPGGYIIGLHAKDKRGCKSLIPLKIKIEVADKPIITINDNFNISHCSPQILKANLDGDTIFNISTPTQYFEPFNVRVDSLPLPDGTGAAHESTIVISEFPNDAILEKSSDLKAICASMEHSWLRDLSIELISPDGRTLMLHNHPGRFGEEAVLGEPTQGDGNNTAPIPGKGYNYCWEDKNPNGDWLTFLKKNPGVRTLPADTYQSYDPFSVLVGSPLNGPWTIKILDHWEADNGWIFEWDITFNKDLPRSIDSFQTTITDFYWLPDNVMSVHTPKEIAYVPTSPGTLNPQVEFVNNIGCKYDTTVSFTVLPQNSPDCEPCQDQIDTLPSQIILNGDTVFFDLEASLNGSNVYKSLVNKVFSFSSNPPSRPLKNELNVLFPPASTLSANAEEIINIEVDIETDAAEDIVCTIVSPSGEELILLRNQGGASKGIGKVKFSVTGDEKFNKNTPLESIVLPFGNWKNLGGSSVEGKWKLIVSDADGFTKESILRSWSISFKPSFLPKLKTPINVFETKNRVYGSQPSNHSFYTFILENPDGCTQTLVYPVLVKQPCKLNIEKKDYKLPSCKNMEDGYASFIASGNQGPVVFEMNGRSDSTGVFNQLKVGQYEVFVIDSAQCQSKLITQIEEPPSLKAQMQQKVISCYPPLYDVDVLFQGNVKLMSFEWLDDTSVKSLNRKNLSPNEYRIKTYDDRGCLAYHPISLRELPTIKTTSKVNAPTCFDNKDGSIKLTFNQGAPPFNIVWENGQKGQSRVNLGEGTYVANIIDNNLCKQTTTIELQQPEELKAEIIIEPNWCQDEKDGAIKINADGGTQPYLYKLDNGPWQDEPLFFGLASDQYLIQIKDKQDCYFEEKVIIETKSDNKILSLNDNYELSFGDSIFLEPFSTLKQKINYAVWRFTNKSKISCDTCISGWITPYESGILNIYGYDNFGCDITYTAKLIVNGEAKVLVPTAFYPDDPTRINNRLRVHGQNGTVIEQFSVFDRWGTQIYESGPFPINSPEGWDGTYQGSPSPSGNYLYKVTVITASGASKQIVGHTLLKR